VYKKVMAKMLEPLVVKFVDAVLAEQVSALLIGMMTTPDRMLICNIVVVSWDFKENLRECRRVPAPPALAAP
jgi:hypothetical protein